MYFSEFTLQLIEEVKKKEILFNTSYDKRPKAEKEGAWSEIAEILNSKRLPDGTVRIIIFSLTF